MLFTILAMAIRDLVLDVSEFDLPFHHLYPSSNVMLFIYFFYCLHLRYSFLSKEYRNYSH